MEFKTILNLPDSGKMRVVVSLSTVPSRVRYLSEIVEYLLKQPYPLNRIYINLPYHSRRENVEYPLPEEECFKDPRVALLRCEDRGPVTKLYPVLAVENDPSTLIITVDDDTQYPQDRIQTLVHWAEKYPNAAVGGDGIIVGSFWNFIERVYRPNEITNVDFLRGFAGTAFRRKFFDQSLLDYTHAPPATFYCDDIWIGLHLDRKDIPRIVHPSDHDLADDMGLPGALSGNSVKNAQRFVSLLSELREKGAFRGNVKTLRPWWSIGFWVLLVILALLLLVALGLSFWNSPAERVSSHTEKILRSVENESSGFPKYNPV